MFNCRQVAQKMSMAMDETLPLSQRLMIWVHLRMCFYCARFARQLRLLREACKHFPPEEHPTDTSPGLSGEARERMIENLKKQIQADRL
jgi:hypothetical protein